jgi:hypothetical protein
MSPNELRGQRELRVVELRQLAGKQSQTQADVTRSDQLAAEIRGIDARLKVATNLLNADGSGGSDPSDAPRTTRSVPALALGMSPREVRNFSITRWIRSFTNGDNCPEREMVGSSRRQCNVPGIRSAGTCCRRMFSPAWLDARPNDVGGVKNATSQSRPKAPTLRQPSLTRPASSNYSATSWSSTKSALRSSTV